MRIPLAIPSVRTTRGTNKRRWCTSSAAGIEKAVDVNPTATVGCRIDEPGKKRSDALDNIIAVYYSMGVGRNAIKQVETASKIVWSETEK